MCRATDMFSMDPLMCRCTAFPPCANTAALPLRVQQHRTVKRTYRCYRKCSKWAHSALIHSPHFLKSFWFTRCNGSLDVRQNSSYMFPCSLCVFFRQLLLFKYPHSEITHQASSGSVASNYLVLTKTSE
jgi:hypothetical protein